MRKAQAKDILCNAMWYLSEDRRALRSNTCEGKARRDAVRKLRGLVSQLVREIHIDFILGGPRPESRQGEPR